MTQPGTRYRILGEIGYTAYGSATDWLDTHGNPIPAWSELPEPQAAAWAAAAQAIEKKLTTPEPGI